MPELLRRVAALTAISVIGIGVLTPLTARSALPEAGETMRLLDAAEAAAPAVHRAALPGREFSAGLSLVESSLPLRAEAVDRPEQAKPPGEVALQPHLVTASTPQPAAFARPVPRPSASPTPAAPPVAPAATTPAPPPPSTLVSGTVWDSLAQCESGGNWSINTGNGYYGGLQFDYATWHSYGGGQYAAYPHQATREQQIAVAERLHAARGFQPWPSCRLKLGLP